MCVQERDLSREGEQSNREGDSGEESGGCRLIQSVRERERERERGREREREREG